MAGWRVSGLVAAVRPLPYSKRITFECTVPLPTKSARKTKDPKPKTKQKQEATPHSNPTRTSRAPAKRREYEQKRNQQPERQQSARDQQRKLRQKAKELGICCACSSSPGPGQQLAAHPVQLADMAHRKLHRNVPRVDGALTVPPQGASCPAGCATRRRRQCSRRQPAPTQPGSQSCRRCWLDPGHCLGRGAAEPVGAGRDGRPMWWEGLAQH